MGSQTLNDNEYSIIKILWDTGRPMRLYEIQEEYNQRTHKDLKYSTISTYLQRMSAKGYLQGVPIKGRKGCAYTPTLGEQEYAEQHMGWFKKLGVKKAISSLAMAFYKDEQLSKKEIQELRDLLERFENK